jgi:hypothetical protein
MSSSSTFSRKIHNDGTCFCLQDPPLLCPMPLLVAPRGIVSWKATHKPILKLPNIISMPRACLRCLLQVSCSLLLCSSLCLLCSREVAKTMIKFSDEVLYVDVAVHKTQCRRLPHRSICITLAAPVVPADHPFFHPKFKDTPTQNLNGRTALSCPPQPPSPLHPSLL